MLGLEMDLRPVNRIFRGIGWRQCAVGEAVIQIPFSDLGLIIDFKFVILGSDVPTMLSTKDLLSNGLDISV